MNKHIITLSLMLLPFTTTFCMEIDKDITSEKLGSQKKQPITLFFSDNEKIVLPQKYLPILCQSEVIKAQLQQCWHNQKSSHQIEIDIPKSFFKQHILPCLELLHINNFKELRKKINAYDDQSKLYLLQEINFLGVNRLTKFIIAPYAIPCLIRAKNILDFDALPQKNSKIKIIDVKWSPDSSQVLVEYANYTHQIFDTTTKKPINTYIKPNTPIKNAKWSPDSSQVCVEHGDRTCQIFDTATKKLINAYIKSNTSITCVEWSPDSSQVLVLYHDNTYQIFDTSTKKLINVYIKSNTSITGAKWSPDSSQVLVLYRDNTYQIFDTDTKEPVTAYLKPNTSIKYFPQWSPDSSLVCVSYDDYTCQIFDTATNQLINAYRKPNTSITNAYWSPNSSQILVRYTNGPIQIFDTATNQPINAYLKLNTSIIDALWSPDSFYVVVIYKDGSARVYNLLTNHLLSYIIEKLLVPENNKKNISLQSKIKEILEEKTTIK